MSPPVPEDSRHPSLDDRYDPAIRMSAYDSTWPQRASRELERIRRALGDLAVRLEHVGSTAVPGLAAKPIIDLQCSVHSVDAIKETTEPLQTLGYLHVPDPATSGYVLFTKPPARPRSYHLHVCTAGSRHETRHIAVRDFLRAHPDEARDYEALKRDLVGGHPFDRLAYIAGKADWMTTLEERALVWADPNTG